MVDPGRSCVKIRKLTPLGSQILTSGATFGGRRRSGHGSARAAMPRGGVTKSNGFLNICRAIRSPDEGTFGRTHPLVRPAASPHARRETLLANRRARLPLLPSPRPRPVPPPSPPGFAARATGSPLPSGVAYFSYHSYIGTRKVLKVKDIMLPHIQRRPFSFV